jgi:uncharacterized membrane protein YfcA
MNMDMATLLYAGAVLFLAYLVRGIAGFGSGLIAVQLLALRFPVTVVVPLVVFLDYVGSASQGLKNRTHIVWRDQLPLIPFSLIGVGVGLLLLSTMSKPDLGKALGGFVLIYAVYQLLPLPPLKGSLLFAVPCGLLGGFIGTLFGTGGPLYVMYFNLRQMAKTGFRATFASNFLIDGGIRLVGYTTAGLFHGAILLSMLAALPVVGAGLYVGGRVHTGFSQETFKRFISVLLLCSGIALLLKS